MKAWSSIKKAIKPKNLIILILLLVANSFAWFIYANEAETKMTAHVRAWRVIFEAGDNEITDYVDIEVDTMYPGMTDFIYTIEAYNRSEMSASLKYAILSANILGEEYITVEGRNDGLGAIEPTDKTSVELLDMLENDLAFSVIFELSSTTMNPETGSATYKITVKWPFESGDDEADTYWGTKAAKYEEENPGEPSITLDLKITIYQSGP